MSHYLLVFARSEGSVIRSQRYVSRQQALAARFEAERQYKDDPDVEVVVLGAESWDSLKRTHTRYFEGLGQIASNARRALAAQPDATAS